MQENFSLDSLNPMNFIKAAMKGVLYFLLKLVIFGIIISVAMKQSGLMDDRSMKTYIMYFLIGSITMYIVTYLYLWYQCRNNKTIDYMKIAKTSILGPIAIITHIVVLMITSFLEVAPEIGILIYLLSWTTFGVVGVSGIIYTSALEIAQKTSYC